jgi:hypothetical protein
MRISYRLSRGVYTGQRHLSGGACGFDGGLISIEYLTTDYPTIHIDPPLMYRY